MSLRIIICTCVSKDAQMGVTMYILPIPRQMEMREGLFVLSYKSKIVIKSDFTEKIFYYGKLLQKDLEKHLGYSLGLFKGVESKSDLVLSKNTELGEEEYLLRINEAGIAIAGGSERGILYGIQTLRQIVSQKGAVLPFCEIRDYPAIVNRGVYHDITRGRIPTLESLKKLADKLSYYKLNQMQLYVEHSYLFQDFSEIWRDDTPLTGEEIIELDAYCKRIGIELVPSLSTFGHLYKALRSKTYEHLCECPEEDKKEFSFFNRMAHHTLDVSNDESLAFSKKLIGEFLPLFSSNQFNICADETFDLGKGKSKSLVDKVGTQEMYISYVSKLCEYVMELGSRPMFWGDVIAGFPEAIQKLPKEVICLNWGYFSQQSEAETKAFYEAGAVQYVCPGVGGWNQFINLHQNCYENIKRMCTYAHKYKALGVLNTDWGDFGHINHPEFSIPGIIYGAAFSWSEKILDFDEINRQISCLEYGDKSETFVSSTAKAAEQMYFDWREVIVYKELGETEFVNQERLTKAGEKNENLQRLKQVLYEKLIHMDKDTRTVVKPYLVAMEGMAIWNEIGAFICTKYYHLESALIREPYNLAADLETWFMDFKEIWRSVGKEAELHRLQEVINWYGDFLRH